MPKKLKIAKNMEEAMTDERAPARAMLRAVGMTDDDFAKPQVGVASSGNEITPCNLSLDRLAKQVKQGVRDGGGFPLEFGTISVSDGISMGHEGMRASLVSREIIADSVECVMHAERLDASVLLAGCDKSLPGMLMAAARLDLAAVFLYAGSILPGRLGDWQITIQDAFEGVGTCALGLITRGSSTRSNAMRALARARAAGCSRRTRWPARRRRSACRCLAARRRRRRTAAATTTRGVLVRRSSSSFALASLRAR